MEIRNPLLRNLLPLCAALLLVACGGGDDGAAAQPAPVAPAPLPPPPPPVGIGTAGGTVSHATGASVVVPAGALTQNVLIEIAQSAAGAPPLPAGVTSAGLVFAFTPHGTTFATPATVTVPFDPALVPAGRMPILYKTNAAQTAYEPVKGAVVSGNNLVGQIAGFSLLTTGTVVPPITLTGPPVRFWQILGLSSGTAPAVLADGGELDETLEPRPGQGPLGDIEISREIGPAYFDVPFEGEAANAVAQGDVASRESGITYWVGAEAPLGNTADPQSLIGSHAQLNQFQSYIKNAADASYHFTITSLFLEGYDGNGSLHRACPLERVTPRVGEGSSGSYCDLVSAQVLLTTSVSDVETDFTVASASGGVSLKGSAGAWEAVSWNDSLSRTALWPTGAEFQLISLPFNGPDGHLRVELLTPRTYSLDLSSLDVGDEFTVTISAQASVSNRANSSVGGQDPEFETAANAWVRDPVGLGGTTVTTTGLTPIATTFPVPTPLEAPVQPAACIPGPAPDPAAGTLQFSAPSYASSESSLAPVVKVTRTGGTLGAVTATFNTSNGSASAGVDYTARNSSVFFAAGDAAARTLTIPLTNDQTDEPDKTVNLTLSQPGGCAALGAQTTAVLTIRDDDVTPQTLFTVGGTVTGLTANSVSGRGLELIDHHGLSLIITADGPFTFTNIPSPTGTAYSVRTGIQPLGFGNVVVRRCAVTNGSGVIADANVTNIQVICTEP